MKPNIIFVLLDGSRWDRVNHSPEFSELLHEGTFLNNVTAAIPYTIGSVNALFTGLYGKENGIDAYYKMFRLKDSVKVLPEVLKEQGYFTACDLLSDKIVSKRGYDIHQFHDEYKDNLTERHPKFINDCLKKANDKPLFLFLHFTRIHTVTVSEILKKYEWDNKEFYEKMNENMKKYDSVFDETSQYAETIYNTIDEIGEKDNTILVFFADHGTGVGERFGERNYGVFTFEETIRTFYLFIGPGIQREIESDKLRSTTDIFPTLLDVAGIESKFNMLGNSIYPFLKGNKKLESKEYTFSETGALQGPYPSPKEPNVFCVKTKRNKLMFFKATNEWKLFDLQNDPLEKQDLFEKEIQTSQKLKDVLLKWI